MKFRILFFSLVSLFIFLAAPVLAVELGGLEETAARAKINTTPQDPSVAAAQVIQWVLSFVGVLFLVLMIYGGVTWMTAGGNEENIAKARKTVGAAVVGLLIVISAYAITIFMGKTFGATQ